MFKNEVKIKMYIKNLKDKEINIAGKKVESTQIIKVEKTQEIENLLRCDYVVEVSEEEFLKNNQKNE
tara:strand:+ start:505 stop:705 length:201 start_codon:yes stop_codon:yes gene_type:complete